jgi:hypothetical protein
LVGGLAEPVNQRDTDTPTAMQLGITAWRILSDTPHYKLVTNYEQDLRMVKIVLVILCHNIFAK